MTNPSGSPLRRRVDFRNDLLPLLFAELRARYLSHSAFLRGGLDEAASVRDQLQKSWLEGNVRSSRRSPRIHVRLLRSSGRSCSPTTTLTLIPARRTRHTCTTWSRPISTQALLPGGSPVKAAQEVTRILRDQMRASDRIRRPDDAVLHRLPVECARTNQSNRSRSTSHCAPSNSSRSWTRASVNVPFGPHPEIVRRRRWSRQYSLDEAGPTHGGNSQSRRTRTPGPALTCAIEFPAAEPPLHQGTPDAVQLWRHHGWECGDQ